MARAFISIGSNIDPAANVRAALTMLAETLEIHGLSTVYRSAAVGRPEQPDFYNCVVEIRTELEPADLKYKVLRVVEAKLGRQRTQDKYAARTIDLDIIFYENGSILHDPEISSRAFLAVPLAELAPDLIIPGTGVTASEIAAAFPNDILEPQGLLDR